MIVQKTIERHIAVQTVRDNFAKAIRLLMQDAEGEREMEKERQEAITLHYYDGKVDAYREILEAMQSQDQGPPPELDAPPRRVRGNRSGGGLDSHMGGGVG